MIRTGTFEAAQANRRHLTLANGTGYWRSDFIAAPSAGPPGPQAFLVEQDPGTVILPHFHQQDQFQVVVAGDGTLGRHAVRPVSVHYAGRHTGYGPITAGTEGLWYFSLRPRTDPGAQFLPEARLRMRNDLPKRHLMGPAVPPAPAIAGHQVVEALPPQPDGIGAWVVRVPPGATAPAPQHASNGGRFYIVIAGELLAADQALPRLATVFVSADDADLPLAAGKAGLEILVLQYPGRD